MALHVLLDLVERLVVVQYQFKVIVVDLQDLRLATLQSSVRVLRLRFQIGLSKVKSLRKHLVSIGVVVSLEVNQLIVEILD